MVIPELLIDRNLRLVATSTFTRYGVDWLARYAFGMALGISPSRERLLQTLGAWAARSGEMLASSDLTRDLDLETEEGFQDAVRRVDARPDDPASAALLLWAKALYAEERLDSADDAAADLAATVAVAVHAHALLEFKDRFEDAAVRGNSIARLRWILDQWRENETNDLEAFWQELLLKSPVVLSQLFACPVIIHGDQVYVGGIRSDGRHAKIADFLLRTKLTESAAIVEIKTPCSQLLTTKPYRQDVFAPHQEISGSVQQILEQKNQILKSMHGAQAELETNEPRVEVIEPQCIIVAGNARKELTTRAQKRSFDMFRNELRSVRVITYDELFGKLAALLELLGASTSRDP